MTLTEFETALRVHLKDSGTTWSDAELDRCIYHAIADLSRFIPREQVYELTLDFDEVSNESVTTESAHGTYKALANKPIKWDSETVTTTAGTTTYTRDTDYTIDYWNGKITTISGGSMAVSTEYYIDYTVDQTTIDISSLTDLIRVDRVEYPVGTLPRQMVDCDVFDDKLTVTFFPQRDERDQTNLFGGKHLRVYYHAYHTNPTDSAAGSHPLFLDEVVVKGSEAYSWLIEAAQYEHQAVTDLASARTELGNISHTNVGTALTAIGTELGLANTALDDIGAIGDTVHAAVTTALALINSNLDSTATPLGDVADGASPDYHALADTALDAAATQIGAASTPLGNVADGQSPDYHALADAALDAANTELDTPSTATTGDIDLGETAHTDVETYTTGATAPSIKKYLEDGDDTITTVNVGDRVAEMYIQYAQASKWIADEFQRERELYLQQAQIRANLANGYYNESMGRLAQVQRKIEEANARSNQGSVYVQEARERLDQINTKINESNAYVTVARGAAEEARMRLAQIEAIVGEANARIATARGYAEQVSFYLYQMDRYIAEAESYIAVAQSNFALADKYRDMGILRRNEFWGILASRAQGKVHRHATSTSTI